MNVNRGPIEKTTGVDLVYFREDLDAFVMVQYKRLTHEGDKWIYRPSRDRNLGRETTRMETIIRSLPPTPTPLSPVDFRYDDDPFFFKLCKYSAVDQTTRDLIGGMYLPHRFWAELQSSRGSRGPRGGVAIGYHNAGRWLSNSLFIALLSTGWIGSQGGGSAAIRDLLRTSLGLRRATVLAVEQQAHSATREEPFDSEFFDDIELSPT
jgi:hypothetical protein